MAYLIKQVSVSTTAEPNDLIVCNQGGIIITLPDSPSDGSAVKIATQEVSDPVTIMVDDLSSIINNGDRAFVLEESFASIELSYNESTFMWTLMSYQVSPDHIIDEVLYTPVEVNSAYQPNNKEMVICQKANIAINLPGEPENKTTIKIAAPSTGPVIAVPQLNDKIAGLDALVIRRNTVTELVYNSDVKEWRAISSSGEAPSGISPDNDVEDERTLVHRSNIKTKDEFKDWIYRKLGYPLVSIELTDEQLDDAIDDALVEFYEYAYQIRKFYAIDLKEYIKGVGVELPIGVVGVSKLTSNLVGPNAVGAGRIDSYMNDLVANGAIGFPMLGRPAGSGWVNYELAMSYLTFSQRMLGGDYDPFYDVRSRMLTLTPDPVEVKMQKGWVVVDCQCVRSDEKQYGDVWVKNMALALAKITLGEIRGKFTNINFPGGGSLNTDLKQEGITERDELRTELRDRYPVTTMFKY